MTENPDNPSPRSDLSRLWQVPLFLASLVLLGLGVARFMSRMEPAWPVRFDQVVAQTEAGAFVEADRLGRELLEDTDAAEKQRQALLYAQLADIRWRSIQATGDRSREQLTGFLEYATRALAAGATLSAEMNRRVGEAHLELGEPRQAVLFFEQAVRGDPTLGPALLRRVIEIRRDRDGLTGEGLLSALDDYLGREGLSTEQRHWALEQKLEALLALGRLDEAEALIARLGATEPAGAIDRLLRFHQAVVLARRGEALAADDLLIALAEELDPADALYPRVQLLRGQLIWPDNPAEARAVLDDVLTRVPGTDLAAAAQATLAQAYSRLRMPEPAREAFSEALRVLRKQGPSAYLDLPGLRAMLSAERAALLERGQPAHAVALAELERQALEAQAPPASVGERLELLGQLAGAHRALAEQAAKALQDDSLAPERREALEAERRGALLSAGAVFRERATLARRSHDAIHGESLRQAARAFEDAGELAQAIDALQAFADGRPSDADLPEVLFALGQACQQAGRYQEAIDAYTRNLTRTPDSERHVMASQGLIPLAVCWMATGAEGYDKAQEILESILADEDVVTPDSALYRDALYALGRLHFQQGRYPQAVAVLGEAIQRYPGQPARGEDPEAKAQRELFDRATAGAFMVAEAYRRSAGQAQRQADQATQPAPRERLLRARVDQLTQADQTYQRVIDRLEQLPGPLDAVQEGYRRNSYFGRADCMYELGQYAQAVQRYEHAVFLFQDDPAAVGGLMQVYNCHMHTGQMPHARAAVERARVLLRRIDPARLDRPELKMSLDAWQRWLDTVEALDPLVGKETT